MAGRMSFMRVGGIQRVGSLSECLEELRKGIPTAMMSVDGMADEDIESLPQDFLLRHVRGLVLYLREVQSLRKEIRSVSGFDVDATTYLDSLLQTEEKMTLRRVSDVKVFRADFKDKRGEWLRAKANLNRAITEMKARAVKYDTGDKKTLLFHALTYYQNVMADGVGALEGESQSTDALIEQYRRHRDEIAKIPSICDGIIKMLADIRRTAAAADRQAASAAAGGASNAFQGFVDEWWGNVVGLLQRLPIVSAEKCARDALQMLKQMKFQQAERRKKEAQRLAKLLEGRPPSPALSIGSSQQQQQPPPGSGATVAGIPAAGRGGRGAAGKAGVQPRRGTEEIEEDPESCVPICEGDPAALTPPAHSRLAVAAVTPFPDSRDGDTSGDGGGGNGGGPGRGASIYYHGGADEDIEGDLGGLTGFETRSGRVDGLAEEEAEEGEARRFAGGGLPDDVESDTDSEGDSFGTAGRLRMGSSNCDDSSVGARARFAPAPAGAASDCLSVGQSEGRSRAGSSDYGHGGPGSVVSDLPGGGGGIASVAGFAAEEDDGGSDSSDDESRDEFTAVAASDGDMHFGETRPALKRGLTGFSSVPSPLEKERAKVAAAALRVHPGGTKRQVSETPGRAPAGRAKATAMSEARKGTAPHRRKSGGAAAMPPPPARLQAKTPALTRAPPSTPSSKERRFSSGAHPRPDIASIVTASPRVAEALAAATTNTDRAVSCYASSTPRESPFAPLRSGGVEPPFPPANSGDAAVAGDDASGNAGRLAAAEALKRRRRSLEGGAKGKAAAGAAAGLGRRGPPS